LVSIGHWTYIHLALTAYRPHCKPSWPFNLLHCRYWECPFYRVSFGFIGHLTWIESVPGTRPQRLNSNIFGRATRLFRSSCHSSHSWYQKNTRPYRSSKECLSKCQQICKLQTGQPRMVKPDHMEEAIKQV
jgi:hypothetical protein